MTFEIPSRPRRRLFRVLVPLLVVGAIILGIVVTAAGAETRAQIEYLTRLGDSARQLADGQLALSDVLGRLRTIDRVEFTTAVDGILADLEVALEALAEEPPNRTVLPTRTLFRQAVEAWQEGITELSTALLQAADRPDEPGPIEQVVIGISMLRVGDTVWAQLLADLAHEDVPDPIRPWPSIIMAPGQGTILPLALGYMEAARAETNTLGLRPGIQVSSIVSDPEWQIDAEEAVVVPVTDRIVFSVVVSNSGNVATGEETLVLTLIGGAEPVEMQLPVEPLEPGRQVTLVFDPVEVDPGATYQVTAAITTEAPDVDPTDNQVVVQFRVGDD